MHSSDSLRIDQAHKPLSFRELSRVYRSIHRYVLTRTLHCQGLTRSFQYLGLHTRTLVSGVAKVIKKPQFWLGAAATTATVVAAAAVSRNSSKVESLIEEGFSRLGEWVEEHLDFVVNLWKKDELKWRLDTIVGYDWNRYILFRT